MGGANDFMSLAVGASGIPHRQSLLFPPLAPREVSRGSSVSENFLSSAATKLLFQEEKPATPISVFTVNALTEPLAKVPNYVKIMVQDGVRKQRKQSPLNSKASRAVGSLAGKVEALADKHGLGAVFLVYDRGFRLRHRQMCKPPDYGPFPKSLGEVSTVMQVLRLR